VKTRHSLRSTFQKLWATLWYNHFMLFTVPPRVPATQAPTDMLKYLSVSPDKWSQSCGFSSSTKNRLTEKTANSRPRYSASVRIAFFASGSVYLVFQSPGGRPSVWSSANPGSAGCSVFTRPQPSKGFHC